LEKHHNNSEVATTNGDKIITHNYSGKELIAFTTYNELKIILF